MQHNTPLTAAKEVFIQGITHDGKTFRPSDWADRLCGVMSPFRPGGPQPGSHLTYSPWCIPTLINGVRCVVVNAELRAVEPMAWDFAINFAKDNNLQMAEACLLPDAPKPGGCGSPCVHGDLNTKAARGVQVALL